MDKLQSSVIGELFLDERDKYLGAVKDYYFTDPSCRILFDVLKKCKYRNDLLGLQKQMEFEGLTNVEKLVKDMMECTANAGTVLSLGNHVELLRQEVVVRKIQSIFFDSNGQLKKEDLEAMHKLTSPVGLKEYTVHSLQDLVLNFEEEYAKRKALYANGFPYPTGFKRLDDYTGGILMGNITVVGARTSFGKSAIMTNMAVNLAQNNVKTLYLSCEMESYELFDRIIAASVRIESCRIKFARLNAYELNEVGKKIGHKGFACKPLLICYTPGLTFNAIASLIDDYKPKVVFVDHLQIMRFESDKGGSRAQSIEDTCYKIKDLAGEYDIGMVVGSQINREAVKTTTNTKMSPAYFKGSGGIEDSAGLALEIKLGEDENKGNSTWNMDIEIQKSRFGKVGTIKMKFEREFARFSEVEMMSPTEDKRNGND